MLIKSIIFLILATPCFADQSMLNNAHQIPVDYSKKPIIGSINLEEMSQEKYVVNLYAKPDIKSAHVGTISTENGKVTISKLNEPPLAMPEAVITESKNGWFRVQITTIYEGEVLREADLRGWVQIEKKFILGPMETVKNCNKSISGKWDGFTFTSPSLSAKKEKFFGQPSERGIGVSEINWIDKKTWVHIRIPYRTSPEKPLNVYKGWIPLIDPIGNQLVHFCWSY